MRKCYCITFSGCSNESHVKRILSNCDRRTIYPGVRKTCQRCSNKRNNSRPRHITVAFLERYKQLVGVFPPFYLLLRITLMAHSQRIIITDRVTLFCDYYYSNCCTFSPAWILNVQLKYLEARNVYCSQRNWITLLSTLATVL